MLPSIVKPKRPKRIGWHRSIEWELNLRGSLGKLQYPFCCYTHGASGLCVISAVEYAHEPGREDVGSEYHLSMTRFGERCSSAEATWVLSEFGLEDALEDNHVPSGAARHFWRPVADRFTTQNA